MKPQLTRTCHPATQRQHGLATLLVVVILLFLATVVIIVVSRTTLMEQRMAANETRSRLAFEAAQAGVDRALVVIRTTGVDANNDDVLDARPSGNLWAAPATSGARFFVNFCQPGVALPANVCDVVGTPVCTEATPSNFNTPLVVSCGWSDDGIGRRLIQQAVGALGLGGGGPTNPLITRGAVNVGGSANVVNYYNNLTVWSGGSLASIGNSGKTFVRNPTVAPPAASVVPPGPPNSCSTSAEYVCLTDKNNTGPDVIANDPTLSNLSTDQMFRNFLGQPTLADYEANVANRVVAAGDAGTLAGLKGEAIVVNGNTTLPNATIGSRERPVVLIINGNLELQGTPTVHGLVYVRGNVTGGGNVTIYGSSVIEGNVQPTGSFDVIYDPTVIEGTDKTGLRGLVPGSWRDWR